MKNFLIFIFSFTLFNLNAQVTFTATDAIAECDGTFQVDIEVANFVDIQSFQYTLDWTEEYISLINTSVQITGGFGGLGMPNNTEGYINFAWGFISPTTISDGTSIITLTFSVLNGYTGNNAMVEINGTQTSLIIQGIGGQNITNYVLNPSTITINDSTPPTLDCPGAISLVTPGGPLQIYNLSPNAMDNCTISSVTYASTGATILTGSDDASGSFFNVGETILTYTIVDGGNNTISCSTTITVTEDVLPSALSFDFSDINISCEADSFSIDLLVTGFTNMTSITMPITFDATIMSYSSYSIQNINSSNAALGTTQANMGILNFAWFDNPGQNVMDNQSILTLNFQIIHAALNSINFDVANTQVSNMNGPIDNADVQYGLGNIIIFDNVDPIITCPGDINVTAVSNDLTTVFGLNPTIDENCSIDSINYIFTGVLNTSGLGALNMFDLPIGTTNLNYIATDFGGNNASCDFNITVSDSPNNGDLTFILGDTTVLCESSIIVIPISVTNFTDITSFQYSINWDPLLYNYDLTLDTLILNTNVLPGLNNVGETQVGQGKVTLAWVDTNMPIGETLPNNTIIGYLTLTPITTNLGTITFSGDPTPISVSNIDGIIDNADINFMSGTLSVIDTTPPVLICLNDTTINLQGGNCMTTFNIVNPIVSDNCSTNITITASTTQTIFGIGTTPITFIATDEEGNIDSCSYNIIVKNIQDIPQFNGCPIDSTIILTNECSTPYTWDIPTAISFCDNNIDITSNYNPGDIFEIGNYTIIYTATNNSGNADTCSFDLNVIDGNIPTLNGCPDDFSITLPEGNCTTEINVPFIYGSTVCEDTIIATAIIPELSQYNPGTYTFAYEVVTQGDIRDTCSFNVTVLGNVETVMTNCPSDTIIYLGQDSCNIYVNWINPTFTNDCESVAINSNIIPQEFGPGNYNISISGITTTDTLTCTFNVMVLDTIAPVFDTCPADIEISIGGDIISDTTNSIDSIFVNSTCDSVQVYYKTMTANDNCISSVSQIDDTTLSSGSWFPIGSTTQMYSAQDTSNNQTNCSFNISITVPNLQINISPNIVCVGEAVTISANLGLNDSLYFWTGSAEIMGSTSTINSVVTTQGGIYSVSAELNNGCMVGPVEDTLVVVENIVATDDNFITLNGMGTTVNLFENDQINTNVPYTFTIISQPSHGSIIDEGAGSIVYTPQENYTGQDEFAYEICYTICNTQCSNAIVVVDNQNTNLTCEIPTLITPNNDGFNDAFIIACLEGDAHPDNTLKIYNQWGDQVYEATPYSNDTPWKGTYKNKDLPDAVYFYIFQEDDSAEILRGSITIYR